jgi:hypothetical protein
MEHFRTILNLLELSEIVLNFLKSFLDLFETFSVRTFKKKLEFYENLCNFLEEPFEKFEELLLELSLLKFY